MIVQHPETVGSGPQLFQTFTVHRSPVTKIMLSEKHLVSGNLVPLVWQEVLMEHLVVRVIYKLKECESGWKW